MAGGRGESPRCHLTFLPLVLEHCKRRTPEVEAAKDGALDRSKRSSISVEKQAAVTLCEYEQMLGCNASF